MGSGLGTFALMDSSIECHVHCKFEKHGRAHSIHRGISKALSSAPEENNSECCKILECCK